MLYCTILGTLQSWRDFEAERACWAYVFFCVPTPGLLHRCVYQREDSSGVVGVELNRDLVKVAGRALERNLTRMGPLVLPLSEQLQFAGNWIMRKLLAHRRP